MIGMPGLPGEVEREAPWDDIYTWRRMFHTLESVLFFGVGPLLWASGLVLFVRSPLSRRRKVIWISVLVAIGIGMGLLLSAAAIREKFVIVLVLLPLLALADVKLIFSRRGFIFWLRACGFEICTAFAVAAWCRYLIETIGVRR